MKCRACDALLSDFEASRKSVETTDITEGKRHYKREYIDLCNQCFELSDNSGMVIERWDLMTVADDKPGLDFEELYDTDFDIDGIPDISSYDT